MKNNDVFSHVKGSVARYSLLKHPFYQMWLDGSLPREAMEEYTKQYFQLVDALPRAVARLYSHCTNDTVRKQLLLNLQEEEIGFGNGGVAHTKLWLQFAESLGVSEKEVREVTMLSGTKAAVDALLSSCDVSNDGSVGLASGAAGLYAYESQVPQISEEKITALKEQYGIKSLQALAFFEVHKIADLKHGAVWKHMVQDNSHMQAGAVAAQESGESVAKALWQMFDSMYEAYVPENLRCACE